MSRCSFPSKNGRMLVLPAMSASVARISMRHTRSSHSDPSTMASSHPAIGVPGGRRRISCPYILAVLPHRDGRCLSVPCLQGPRRWGWIREGAVVAGHKDECTRQTWSPLAPAPLFPATRSGAKWGEVQGSDRTIVIDAGMTTDENHYHYVVVNRGRRRMRRSS